MSSLSRFATRRVTSAPVAVPVLLLAVAAAFAWLPFLDATLTRDEAGLLMVGRQWGPGVSVYGDYFVDRPPLLIALFSVVSPVGDGTAVRVMGAVAAAASVVAAAALGRAIAPLVPKAPVALAAVAAVATATPLMGAGAVNAEILAVPFVLGGSWAMVRALRHRSSTAAVGLAVVAGMFGASAALVKQNFIDVFVFAAVALVLLARHGRESRCRALALTGAVAAGGLLTGLPVLGLAALLGSSPLELWDATVVFRGEASAVLAASATVDTTQRFAIMIAALLATALPLVVLSVLPDLMRPETARSAASPGSGPDGSEPTWPPFVDLRLPAAMLLAWELLGVILGGSYWLHYLVALVPGVALLVGVALQRHSRGWRGFCVTIAIASFSTVLSVVITLVHPETFPEQASIDYLRAHAEAGETGVVAFGAPNILEAAGLTSPYPYLWSLPVRVRDPQLSAFAAVLAGPNRPDWLVLAGASIATWGVDDDDAQPYVERYYTYRSAADGFRIYSLTENS